MTSPTIIIQQPYLKTQDFPLPNSMRIQRSLLAILGHTIAKNRPNGHATCFMQRRQEMNINPINSDLNQVNSSQYKLYIFIKFNCKFLFKVINIELY